MNKQELIDELAKYVKRYENVTDEYSQGRYGAYEVSFGLAKKLDEPQITAEQAWNKIAEAYPESAQSLRNTLDNAVFGKSSEPQKPVIPPELAEYIQDNEGESIGDVFSYEWLTHYDNQQLGDKVAKWLFDNDKDENNRRYLIAVQAFITGDYEVEKEPLYRVKLGEGYFAKYLGIGALIIPDDTREFKIFNSKSDAERTASTIGGTVEEVAEG